MHSESNQITWRQFLENPETLNSVNIWLKDKLKTNFRLRKSIKLKTKDDLLKLKKGLIPIEDIDLDGYEGIKIEDTRIKNRLLDINDVGYGLQKLIPVLAAGSAIKFDKSNITNEVDIIAIEEPEMHLHPKLQSDLGDLFVDNVIGNTEKTFVIETHSEHLLLRILKRVRDGDLSKDSLSVLYVHPGSDDKGAKVERLELDDDGDFMKPWPSGFFDVRHNNLF
jgi:predicted ATPase